MARRRLVEKGELPDILGNFFENFVRDELNKLNKSNLLTDVKIFKTSFKFIDKNGKKGDIDLIIKIGKKLIEQYLAEPPQINMFFQNVRRTEVCIPNLPPNKKHIKCVKSFVKSPNF